MKEAIRFIEMAAKQLGMTVKQYQALLEAGVEVRQDNDGLVVEVVVPPHLVKKLGS